MVVVARAAAEEFVAVVVVGAVAGAMVRKLGGRAVRKRGAAVIVEPWRRSRRSIGDLPPLPLSRHAPPLPAGPAPPPDDSHGPRVSAPTGKGDSGGGGTPLPPPPPAVPVVTATTAGALLLGGRRPLP